MLQKSLKTYFPRESQKPNSTWEREVYSETAQLRVMVQPSSNFLCKGRPQEEGCPPTIVRQ